MEDKDKINRELLLAKFNSLLKKIFFTFEREEAHSEVKGMKAFALQEDTGEEKGDYFNSLLMFHRDFYTWIIEGLHVGLYEEGNKTTLPTRFGLVNIRDQIFFRNLEKWKGHYPFGEISKRRKNKYTLSYCPPSELLARALNFSMIKKKEQEIIEDALGRIIAVICAEELAGELVFHARPDETEIPLERLDNEVSVDTLLIKLIDERNRVEGLNLEFISENKEYMNALGKFDLHSGDSDSPLKEGYFSLLPDLGGERGIIYQSIFPLDKSILDVHDKFSLKLKITPWKEQNTESFRKNVKEDLEFILNNYNTADYIHPSVLNAIESLLPAPEGMSII